MYPYQSRCSIYIVLARGSTPDLFLCDEPVNDDKGRPKTAITQCEKVLDLRIPEARCTLFKIREHLNHLHYYQRCRYQLRFLRSLSPFTHRWGKRGLSLRRRNQPMLCRNLLWRPANQVAEACWIYGAVIFPVPRLILRFPLHRVTRCQDFTAWVHRGVVDCFSAVDIRPGSVGVWRRPRVRVCGASGMAAKISDFIPAWLSATCGVMLVKVW
ncbi:hypothetical protein KC19_6G224100 [Ceratodon purpureus]|uniref:Uncharacterized protein n=1 Tax=Ceratodon purpureus TaxID=3225 RepID=A0A8T0HKE3_CERPU|nr:hypothetical protein KC19_6G224100 [Ceratodon purpureus]